MSMTDKEAAGILRIFQATIQPTRGNGKSGIALRWNEAILKAISALEKEPRPVIVKSHVFECWYCPACFQRVKRGGRFCHACGQAYRARRFYDDLETISIPPPKKPHDGTPPPRIVIFDESEKAGGD